MTSRTSVLTVLLALLLGAAPALGQVRLPEAGASAPPELTRIAAEAPAGIVAAPVADDPATPEGAIAVSLSGPSSPEALRTPAALRAVLLAPVPLRHGRRVCIDDALALLWQTTPLAPPDWLDELSPVFEAHAAVEDATRFDGDGYVVHVSPLKLRCTFRVRLGGSLGVLRSLLGGAAAATGAETVP